MGVDRLTHPLPRTVLLVFCTFFPISHPSRVVFTRLPRPISAVPTRIRPERLMKFLTLLSVLCVALCCAGQQAPDLGAAADTAYQAQNWQEAEKLYQQLIEAHPA